MASKKNNEEVITLGKKKITTTTHETRDKIEIVDLTAAAATMIPMARGENKPADDMEEMYEKIKDNNTTIDKNEATAEKTRTTDLTTITTAENSKEIITLGEKKMTTSAYETKGGGRK